jgi:hypothetical protein
VIEAYDEKPNIEGYHPAINNESVALSLGVNYQNTPVILHPGDEVIVAHHENLRNIEEANSQAFIPENEFRWFHVAVR